jgi:choline-sulfatase
MAGMNAAPMPIGKGGLLPLSGQVSRIQHLHGDAFGEHGIHSDHVCADECIHHVPPIIRWPGLAPGGAICDALLYTLDLAPTLCGPPDLPAPSDWDGRSFLDALRGERVKGRDYLVWDHGLYTVQRAARTRQHLMVRTYDNFGYTSFEPVALYDMEGDPTRRPT